jgi:hypothetical protein
MHCNSTGRVLVYHTPHEDKVGLPACQEQTRASSALTPRDCYEPHTGGAPGTWMKKYYRVVDSITQENTVYEQNPGACVERGTTPTGSESNRVRDWHLTPKAKNQIPADKIIK